MVNSRQLRHICVSIEFAVAEHCGGMRSTAYGMCEVEVHDAVELAGYQGVANMCCCLLSVLMLQLRLMCQFSNAVTGERQRVL
jgi:hypothetical protein